MDQDKEMELLLKQYELMVNSSMQLTSWRQTTNAFYLAIISALFVVVTSLIGTIPWSGMPIGIVGAILSYLWYGHIEYFAKLNESKFEVIGQMERKMPIQAFEQEEECFRAKKCKRATKLEKNVAALFAFLNVVVIIISAYVAFR